jgi:hypothetical protein
MSQHNARVAADPDRALAAVGEAAEIWGGEWQRLGTGGRIELPVTVGIRHGYIEGEVTTARDGDATEVTVHVERSDYNLHWPSFMVLLFGAVGGLGIVAAPFFPALFPLAPAGVILSLAAWFMVASRVRTRAEREFFELVDELLEERAPPGIPPAP